MAIKVDDRYYENEDTINGGRFTFFRDPDGLPLELHE